MTSGLGRPVLGTRIRRNLVFLLAVLGMGIVGVACGSSAASNAGNRQAKVACDAFAQTLQISSQTSTFTSDQRTTIAKDLQLMSTNADASAKAAPATFGELSRDIKSMLADGKGGLVAQFNSDIGAIQAQCERISTARTGH